MARAHLRHLVKDRAGNAIENALVTFYAKGTGPLAMGGDGTLEEPDGSIYAAEVGGAALADWRLESNAQGEVEAWIDPPCALDVWVTDNSQTAYYSGKPSKPISFASFGERIEIPGDLEAHRASVGDHADVDLTGAAAGDVLVRDGAGVWVPGVPGATLTGAFNLSYPGALPGVLPKDPDYNYRSAELEPIESSLPAPVDGVITFGPGQGGIYTMELIWEADYDQSDATYMDFEAALDIRMPAFATMAEYPVSYLMDADRSGIYDLGVPLVQHVIAEDVFIAPGSTVRVPLEFDTDGSDPEAQVGPGATLTVTRTKPMSDGEAQAWVATHPRVFAFWADLGAGLPATPGPLNIVSLDVATEPAWRKAGLEAVGFDVNADGNLQPTMEGTLEFTILYQELPAGGVLPVGDRLVIFSSRAFRFDEKTMMMTGGLAEGMAGAVHLNTSNVAEIFWGNHTPGELMPASFFFLCVWRPDLLGRAVPE